MKVAMKFGSLTTATTPGGSGNGGTVIDSSSGESIRRVMVESVEDFSSMQDSDVTYFYKKEDNGRFINEVASEIVEGTLPSGYDDKNTFYFIKDV